MYVKKKKMWPLLGFMAVFMIAQTPIFGIEFKLPFRMAEKQMFEPSLENTRIRLNGEERSLIEIKEHVRIFGVQTELGKNYILSFHAGQFSQRLEEGISYFVTEILQPHDALILITPLKVYSIAVSANKAKIIMDIEKLMSEDYELYEKDKKSLESILESELAVIRRNVSSFMQTHDDEVTIYKRVAQFLYNYGEIYTNYRNRYLIPSLQTNLSLNEILGEREGERWWVHFHHRGNVRLIKKINDVIHLLHEYIDELQDFEPTLGRTMKFHLSSFEKEIDITGSFDYQKLLDEILLENISYMTVFWGHQGSDGSQTQGKIISGLWDSFISISEKSGGKAVIYLEPEEGLMNLTGHRDRYYELVFEVEDKPAEVVFEIDSGRLSSDLSYRKSFSEEQVSDRINRLTAPKVEISDLVIKRKRNVTFFLSGFNTDKINRIGMLKVQLSLLSESEDVIYTTSNILRASEKMVELSVPLPKEHKGDFTLVVNVIDMMANKMDSVSDHITIK